MIQTHPNAARIVRDFEAWGEAAKAGEINMPRTPLERPHDWRCDGCGHVRSEREKPRSCFHCLADTFSPLSACNERERIELELRIKSPKRAEPGKPQAGQKDANHLPLFVAANEPGLF